MGPNHSPTPSDYSEQMVNSSGDGLRDAHDRSEASLPQVELAWRKFRRNCAEGTEVWEITIEPDGETFRFKTGYEGRKINEYRVRPGEQGRPGSATYLSAAEACAREVERRIRRRCEGKKGQFTELGEATPDKSEVSAQFTAGKGELDFSKPFPKDLHTPKPVQSINHEEFKRLHNAGLTRITRKYDGMGLIVVNHTYGWEIYTLSGNVVTQFYPNHVAELQKMRLGPGTVLKAEGVLFKTDDPMYEDFRLTNAKLGPSRRWENVRSDVENGYIPEPSMIFYDILYRDGVQLSNVSYDDRSKAWNHLPVARGGNGLLLSAEYFDITPENWDTERIRLGFEGFVVMDGSSTLGEKVISFSSTTPRPKGCYKLKPNIEEDVVIFAVREVDGKYESVFTKQRYPEFYPGTEVPHPRSGEWFYSGRVSIAGKKDVAAIIDNLVREGKIRSVPNNKTGESIDINNSDGIVCVIECFERQESNKFRHPKFTKPTRFRHEGADFKPPEDCTATNLGTKPTPEEFAEALESPEVQSDRYTNEQGGKKVANG